ncbi:MAG: adenosylcobinamide-GDP ribazoletransferase, partial [Pseudomonadota bacterium]
LGGRGRTGMNPRFRLIAQHELATFALAMQFLTRLPVPVGNAYTPERMAATPRYYPLVGALVGLLCAMVYMLTASKLTPVVGVLLAVAAGLLLTGAFHEDGLADTFDGLGSADRDKALAIMRDSRIGTYGALALISVLALKAAALTALAPNHIVTALIVAHGLSRLSAVLVIATSTYARDHGTGKPTAEGIDQTGLAMALGTGAVLLILMAVAFDFSAMVAVAVGTAAGHVAMRTLFERRLRGYTGDTLGAVQQISELGAYLGLLWWH